ncbi:MAG TPA: NADPH-dependent FMN reductase [Steroidobacter sp.]|uniref:NADPH-dependent FMN reductase n=1 Tax=Steroidobacter sp. TaxID=1978227 RepID=UPI002EDA7B85
MTSIRVAMLVASARTGSINRRLAKAIECLSPAGMRYFEVPMYEMPFYHGDLEADRPRSVRDFTDAIAAADAVSIVTPEFNRSIPAVLKNAIDWGSKPLGANVWKDKVIAMTGASPGAIGTAVGQQHLRQILSILGGLVLPGEVYISFKSPDMIDDGGRVADKNVEDFLRAYAERFHAFVMRMRAQ